MLSLQGIFSAGIFVTTDESWVEYVGATVPITVLTIVAGVCFLQQQRIRRWGRGFAGRSAESGAPAAAGGIDALPRPSMAEVA